MKQSNQKPTQVAGPFEGATDIGPAVSFLPASANGRHQINTFLEESKAFLRVAPPGPSSPRHGGLWLQPSSQFCSPIPSSSGSQTPPAPVGLPASGHMSSLCRDVTDGNGGVRSDMPGGEEKNLGWRKYRQKHSFALFFFFPDIFILLELQDFSLHLKRVRKHLINMILLLGVTRIALLPQVKLKRAG